MVAKRSSDVGSKQGSNRWMGPEIDSDPYLLPARIAAPAQALTGRALGFIRYATIYRDAVTVNDSSPILGVWSWSAEIRDYLGIAVRMAYRGRRGTDPAIIIELRHTDPAKTIPLHVSFDGADVSARWRSWSNVLGLPILVESREGELVPAEQRLGQLVIDVPQPHRGASPLTARRPQTYGFNGKQRYWSRRAHTGTRPHAY